MTQQHFRENRTRTLALVLILTMGGIIVWEFSSHHETPLDAMRKKGYPVTLAELNAWYKPVPEAQNNARFYEEAFALPVLRNLEEIPWLERGRALFVEDRKELSELLVTNQLALRLLHSAQATNRCRYSEDLNKLLSAYQNPGFRVLNGVRLLAIEALLHAADGDSQQATSSFLAAGTLADSFAEEPSVISQILRGACWRVLVRRLEHGIALTQMTEEQLASLQRMVVQAERPEALLRGLVGEQAMGIAAFADAFNVMEYARQPASLSVRLKDSLLIGLSKTTGAFERDRKFYLDCIEKSVAAASLPFPERLKLGLQIPNPRAAPRYSMMTAILLPKLAELFASEADTTARLRSAQMALAVERFRRRHEGRLPARLEELVPDYCKAVPVDLFDGKQLRFRTFASGYVIYSIGPDGRDDDGAEPDPNNSQAPHDIGFKVEWDEPL